ncbi:MAG TPA: YCF48-related protein [Vicinamibacterales bacterium]|nr:YCF48-related protein [Vicinamibacterales bacterium]
MTDARHAREDRGLERLLRQGLPPADPGDEAACLDADTIAAWIEDGLNASERAAAEVHAAGCARCQSMLAVMMRTMPADAEMQGSAIRRWTMMFAPALAAAAALALWFAVERPAQRLPESSQSAAASNVGEPPVVPAPATAVPSPAGAPMTESAKKEAELMLSDALRKTEGQVRAAAPASSDARGLRRTREQEDKSRANLPDKDAAAKPAADALADTRLASGAARAPVARSQPGAAAAAPAPPPAAAPVPLGAVAETVTSTPPVNVAKAGEERRRAEPSLPSATPPAQQQTMQQPTPQQVAQQPQSVQQQAGQQQASQQRPDQQQAAGFAARGAVAAPQPAESDRAAGRLGGIAETVQVNTPRSATDVIAFRSPNDNDWWRITGGRVAQVSTDKGTTWSTRYAADANMSLTAGSAASPSTVWMVGRGGAVLVTTDGRSWRRVAFPERVDLAAVTAVDARHATVITMDGRSFTTTDAGVSWTRK